MATFVPITKASKQAYTLCAAKNSLLLSLTLNISPLKHTLCIHYLPCFKKDQTKVQALSDIGSEINTIAPVYIASLGLIIKIMNVKAQKIDGSTFSTFDMALASSQANNKLSQSRFFKEIFLMTNIGIKIILDIAFLTFNNANIRFIKKKRI